MARRPEVAKHVLNRQDLADLNRRLSTMSVTAVRDFYHSAHLACRLDGDRVPSARKYSRACPGVETNPVLVEVCRSDEA